MKRLTSANFGIIAVLIFLLLTIVTESRAQEGATPTAVQPIRKFERFPFTDIKSMIDFTQDSEGFFWFGSDIGLYKWDGCITTHYTPKNFGFPTVAVFSLYVDRQGILWLATQNEGLFRYDKATNTFRTYKNDPADPTSISSSIVGQYFFHQAITQDQEGGLWVATTEGLNRLDQEQERFTRYQHDPNVPGSLIDNQVLAVLIARDGTVWAGTKSGLCRLNKGTETFKCYTHDPDNPYSLSHNAVQSLLEDRTGTLWIGTADGLNRFDSAEETFTVYRTDSAGLGGNNINAMTDDDAGYLWLAHKVELKGVSVFDPRMGTAVKYLTSNDPTSLAGNATDRIYKDRHGNIWIGDSFAGLSKYDSAHQSPFTSFVHNPDAPSSLKGQAVFYVFEHPAGQIWVTSYTVDNLQSLDRTTGAFTARPLPAEMKDKGVFTGTWTSDGEFWVNDAEGTLYHLDFDTMTLIKSYKVATNLITWMVEDRRDPAILWLCTIADGLLKFNRTTGEIIQYKNVPGDSTSLSNNIIWSSILQDNTNPDWLWVGTNSGLNLFNARTGKVERIYRHDEADPTSIANDNVGTLYQSATGEMWVATFGGGLSKFDPQAGTFTAYSNKNGLFPSDQPTAILADTQGDLWVGSQDLAGLVRFTPATGTFKVYGQADGVLVGTPYNFGFHKASNGDFWFTGSGGVTVFDPTKVVDNSYKPPAYITSLTQGGESMKLPAAPEKLKTIILSWEAPFFEFTAAALNYTRPEKNQYKYMLEGWDTDWFNAGTDNKGRYSGLRGGTYTLKVMGSNNDGLWSDRVAELKITVTSPFYNTAWFYTLCGALSFGVIGFIYRTQLQVRTQRLKAEREAALHQAAEREKVAAQAAQAATQREKEAAEMAKEAAQREKEASEEKRQAAEAANRAKSTFLSNMSHELRTPLNGILGYAQILSRDRSLTTLQKDGLQIIYDSGSHLLTLINDILDLAKVEAGKLELAPAPFHLPNFLDSIAGIIRMRAEQKNILFKYQATTPLPDGVCGDEKRLRQVLLNLLGNAVKFTNEGSVTLRASVLSSRPATPDELAHMSASDPRTIDLLRFEVMDTGVGIKPDDQQKLFKAFEQVGDMQTRAEGTGLGLAISRRLVEMMGGEIEVKSAPGQGSTFWFEVELPGAAVSLKTVQQRSQEIAGYAGRRLKVLVADDKLSNRLVMVHLLEPLGFVMELAENGRELLAKAQTFKPDIIFTDLVMPVMTGFEAAERFRQMPAFQQTPLIATSASVFEMDRKKSRVAGCDDFLPKPIVASQLFDILSTHVHVEWVYSESDVVEDQPTSEDALLVPPPVEERETFYDLALGGDMDELTAYADRIEALGAQYQPFAQKLRDMVKRFQDTQILALAEQYLEEAKLAGASGAGA